MKFGFEYTDHADGEYISAWPISLIGCNFVHLDNYANTLSMCVEVSSVEKYLWCTCTG